MNFPRKTAPKVRDGQVRRKNRHRPEPSYVRSTAVRIEREKPAKGYQHFVSPNDVTAFLNLLPDWNQLSLGLDQILLAGNSSCHGWFRPGIVALCAWDDDCVQEWDREFLEEHLPTLDRLGVKWRPHWNGWCFGCYDTVDLQSSTDRNCPKCGREIDPAKFELWDPRRSPRRPFAWADVEFNDETVQAFQLLHILLHEIGHHYDCMTSPRQRHTTRGESFAEAYAVDYERRIFPDYCRVFRFQPRR